MCSYPATFGYGFATAQDQAWTLDMVLEATGGRLVGTRDQIVFRSVSTDSRTLEAGDLFVALTGENFNGERFVADAISKGAAAVIVSKGLTQKVPVPAVIVEDTLRALGDLAAFRRRLMKNLKVIAITGSSGKTTVKEMTATILARKMNVLKTSGNFNNLVGLPLSLLPVDSAHQIAVLEMGMNRSGEIARMTEIAAPDIACINNVQNAHLQGLHDLQGVANAKGELFAGIGADACLVVNLDDSTVSKLAASYPQKQITYGRHRRAMIRATYIHQRGEGGVSFTLIIGKNKERVRLGCVGRHNVFNALAAAGLAHAVGLELKDICLGLAEFTPYDKRLQIETLAGGLKVVNDTYNANPSSMLAALETLQSLKRNRRAVVVLGDMLELGKESISAHRFVGGVVARLNFDYLFTFGAFSREVVEAARAAGMDNNRARSFGNKEDITEFIRTMMGKGEIGTGDWLLVKGSRGVQMETVINELKETR